MMYVGEEHEIGVKFPPQFPWRGKSVGLLSGENVRGERGQD